MNARFDEAVWAGVIRRLSEVERHIPDAPAWRPSTGGEMAMTGTITLGTAFGRGRTGPSQRARLVRVLVVAAAILALVGAALLVGSRPRVDLRTGPFGPLGILRGSDGHSHAALLTDGRVLIVSGAWGNTFAQGRADIWGPEGDLVRLAPPRAARVNPTVTLLLDGRVLVVGGYGGQYMYASSAIASAEVWDPRTEAFTPTGSMSSARVGHAATLLADGRVLVTGGSGPTGTSRAAEVWDPDTGQFTPAGAMGIARGGHASVLLPDGDVLVAGGGVEAGVEAGLVEVWSSSTQRFRDLTVYLDRPSHVSATRLLDGGILAAGLFKVPYEGGFGGVEVLQSAFSREPSQLAKSREGHAATLLPNGDVLITGGRDISSQEPLDSAERWGALTGTFRAAPALAAAVAGHDAILLPDGRVLIVPDASGPEGFVAPFIYDPGDAGATR